MSFIWVLTILIFLAFSLMAFLGRFQWTWAFGTIIPIILLFVFTLDFSNYLLSRLHIEAVFQGLSSELITLIGSLITTSFSSIAIVSSVNKQRDMMDSRRETKREDYKNYETRIDNLLDFLVEWQAKFLCLSQKGMIDRNMNFEKFIKGILKYQILLTPKSLNSFLNNPFKNKGSTINEITKNLDSLYKQTSVEYNKAKSLAEKDIKDNYTKAVVLNYS